MLKKYAYLVIISFSSQSLISLATSEKNNNASYILQDILREYPHDNVNDQQQELITEIKEYLDKKFIDQEQEFITENGTLGIYQKKYARAYIGDNVYKDVVPVLITVKKRTKKPWRKTYLGTLIENDRQYKLYGKLQNDVPINDNPDADVRTEEKIAEDFGRNFGSGQYTPHDKWD